MKKQLTILATISLLALAVAGTARAQVINAVVADIPFQFTVGKMSLPAGQDTVKPFGSMPGNLMALTDKQGKILEVFTIEDTQANTPPHQAELIFRHVGDQYFLQKVFDQANQLGGELQKPKAERQLEKDEAMNSGSSDVTVFALNAASK